MSAYNACLLISLSSVLRQAMIFICTGTMGPQKDALQGGINIDELTEELSPLV